MIKINQSLTLHFGVCLFLRDELCSNSVHDFKSKFTSNYVCDVILIDDIKYIQFVFQVIMS
jgi:hypothetical protein